MEKYFLRKTKSSHIRRAPMQYILEFIQCLLGYREPRSFRLFPSHCLDPCCVSSHWHEMVVIDHMTTSVEEKRQNVLLFFYCGGRHSPEAHTRFPFQTREFNKRSLGELISRGAVQSLPTRSGKAICWAANRHVYS